MRINNFEFANNILTYTETSIAYDVEFSDTNNEIALYGRNVSRNLFYQRIVTSDKQGIIKEKTDLNNSSELKK